MPAYPMCNYVEKEGVEECVVGKLLGCYAGMGKMHLANASERVGRSSPTDGVGCCSSDLT